MAASTKVRRATSYIGREPVRACPSGRCGSFGEREAVDRDFRQHAKRHDLDVVTVGCLPVDLPMQRIERRRQSRAILVRERVARSIDRELISLVHVAHVEPSPQHGRAAIESLCGDVIERT